MVEVSVPTLVALVASAFSLGVSLTVLMLSRR